MKKRRVSPTLETFGRTPARCRGRYHRDISTPPIQLRIRFRCTSAHGSVPEAAHGRAVIAVNKHR